MALEASICNKCGSKGLAPENTKKCFCGGDMILFNVTKDEYCKISEYEINQMIEQMGIKPLISKDDAYDIYRATNSTEIIDAMIELKQKDIIEYGLKLSQFRTQIGQQSSNRAQKDNKVHCKYCNSTNTKKISSISKAGSVAMFGIFSKKVHKEWHCNNCNSDF